MPYKNKNIDFGMNKSILDRNKMKEDSDNLEIGLGLKYHPVAVKIFFDKSEFAECEIPVMKGKASYCQMVLRAGKGEVLKSTLENHICDGATTALALENSNSKIESGEEYFSYNLYGSKSSARRMRESIQSFRHDVTTAYGVLVGNLNDFPIVPDVIIFIVNPYQAMRLSQGYVYRYGVKPKLDMGGMQAVCSELTVVPMKSGDMNISTFCPSTRMLCKWEDSEMGVSIPFEKLDELVQGIFGTMNTTDNKKRKLEIIERFKQNGKEIDLDPDVGY
ncbi:MAG: DUF169 domain-containing protein [Suipraeoptans sp.]